MTKRGGYQPHIPAEDPPQRYQQVLDLYRLFMEWEDDDYPWDLMYLLERCARLDDGGERRMRLPEDSEPKERKKE